MNRKTFKALKGSIASWESIVENGGLDNSEHDCQLCDMFIDNDDCKGCPVAESGSPGCNGSPYDQWARFVPFRKYPTHPISKATTKKYKALAQAELDFLESLLPEKEPK